MEKQRKGAGGVGRVGAMLVLAGITTVLTACGDGGGTSGGRMSAAESEFCGPVMARVDSFLAAASDRELSDQYGGTVVVGGIGELDGMNALTSTGYQAAQHQEYMTLMTLAQYDENLRPVPYLAESWELSEDGTELTFRLRDEVRWHDGERTDAYDVEFTYLRATDPATGFPNASIFRYYEPGAAGVEVLDSLTVRFRMRPHVQPIAPWARTGIMPEHLLGDVPSAELRQHPFGSRCPVGNGPFVFREHRQNESWTFVANPWFPEGLGGRPYVDRYVYQAIPEQTTLLTDLLTGGVDVYIGVRPDQTARIEETAGVGVVSFPSRQYTFAGWNARIPELSDPRVRRALTHGTNRQQIIDAIWRGYAEIANTSVPPFHWAYSSDFADALPYDPDRARELLEEAGWVDRDGDGVRENEDGIPLEITLKYNQGNQSRQDVAEIMQAQLREVGVRIVPQVVEWTTLLSQLIDTENRPIEGVVLGWVVNFRLDDTDLFHSDAADAEYGFAGTQVPEIDQLLDTLPLIPDREEAQPLWNRYQELIVEHQPYTFLYFPDRINGVAGRVRGAEMDVRGDWVNVARWWIPADERIYQGTSE
ncbi:MAG: ABC transporter substrate-binding protein [Longimicrobiales bacterium]|nr:ABC transporter substrate-binding protein [Longimicrobiales bacterium]